MQRLTETLARPEWRVECIVANWNYQYFSAVLHFCLHARGIKLFQTCQNLTIREQVLGSTEKAEPSKRFSCVDFNTENEHELVVSYKLLQDWQHQRQKRRETSSNGTDFCTIAFSNML